MVGWGREGVEGGQSLEKMRVDKEKGGAGRRKRAMAFVYKCAMNILKEFSNLSTPPLPLPALLSSLGGGGVGG